MNYEVDAAYETIIQLLDKHDRCELVKRLIEEMSGEEDIELLKQVEIILIKELKNGAV